MATVKCGVCQTKDSITFCSESGLPLCPDCAITCDVCQTPINFQRAQETSTGRKLCAKCMAQRNERRKAKRDKLKKRAAGEETPQPAPAAPAEPVKMPRTVGAPGLGSTAFEDINSGINIQPAARPQVPAAPRQAPAEGAPIRKSTSFEDLHTGADFDAAPPQEFGAQEFGDDESEFDEDGKPKKKFGLEGVPTDVSGRLELPPMDEHRPVLGASGYRAPTKTAYALAFIFFGVAGVIFYSSTPLLGDILFPFDTPDIQFNEGEMPQIQDTNRLRNTGNVSQFEIFAQAPIFFIAWFILIVYLGGCARIIWSVGYSATSSFLAKRRKKRIEKKYGGKDPFSELG